MLCQEMWNSNNQRMKYESILAERVTFSDINLKSSPQQQSGKAIKKERIDSKNLKKKKRKSKYRAG